MARKESPFRLKRREAAHRRRQAARALRVLAEPPGVATLTSLLDDSNPHVREAAAEALVSGFVVEGVNVLLDALGSEKVEVRLAALHALPNAGYIPKKIDALIGCLTDPDPEARRRAAACLLQFSPVYRDSKIPGLIEGLEKAAADVDPAVSTTAQKALAAIRPVAESRNGSLK